MEGSRFEQSGALLDEDDVDGSIESGTVDVGNVGHNSVKEVHGWLFTRAGQGNIERALSFSLELVSCPLSPP